MKVYLVDKKQGTILCTADILFGLDSLIVTQCTGKNPCELQQFLEQRAYFDDSVEQDEKVLKKLNLYQRRNLFGRMSEANVLYSMLSNFEKPGDSLALYPQKDEFVCMAPYNANYSNLYSWRANHDFNAWGQACS